MKNLKIEKISIYLIVLIFLCSYILYSFIKPPLYTLTEGPADVFYYLVYAREAANLNFFSWNGLYPSNGFHPLWLIFVSICFIVSENLTIVVMLLSIFLFIFFLISINFFNKIIKIYNDDLLRIVFIFIFAIISSKFFFWYMESALSALLFLIYIYQITYKFNLIGNINNSKVFSIGLISSLIVLTRLDLALLIAPIHGFLILNSLIKKNMKIALYLALTPIIIVGAYIILIFFITGSPIPLSGVVKSTFPEIFRETDWSQLLIKQTKFGIFLVAINLSCTIISFLLIKFSAQTIISSNQKKHLVYLLFLLIGSFLHLSYHVSFSDTGSIGRWYFVIYLLIATFSICLLLSILKKICDKKEFFNFLSSKILRYIFVTAAIPLIFYTSLYSREAHDFKKTETYSIMRFAENLDKKKFNKSLKIYDGTDGSFAFFSKIPTFHVKGMAATPEYVLKKKKMFNQVCDFTKNFLIEEKIDYVLVGEKIEKNSHKEKDIKEISDYNMIDTNEDLIITYYLIKSNKYIENKYEC